MANNKYNFVMQNFVDLPVKMPYFSGNMDRNNYFKYFSTSESSKYLDDDNQNLCPICYDKIKDECFVEDCLHRFCYKCINIWKKNKCLCPICRSQIKKITKIHKNLEYFNKKRNLEIKLLKKK